MLRSYVARSIRRLSPAAEEAGSDMSGNLRISTFNGALLAAYFIPAWTITAFKIVVSPIHGLYERPNISLGLFVSDHLQLSGLATVRVAWLLALGRMTVVAFLAVFLVFISRASIRKAGGCNEALGMALAIGSVMSFAGVVMASQAGETAALRLHAAELLMMLGTVIVMLIERPTQPQAGNSPAGLTLQQTC
jgi:hypothetical protein